MWVSKRHVKKLCCRKIPILHTVLNTVSNPFLALLAISFRAFENVILFVRKRSKYFVRVNNCNVFAHHRTILPPPPPLGNASPFLKITMFDFFKVNITSESETISTFAVVPFVFVSSYFCCPFGHICLFSVVC